VKVYSFLGTRDIDQLVPLSACESVYGLRFGMGDLRRVSALSVLVNEVESTNMHITMTTSTSRRRYGHSRPSSDVSLAGFPLRAC
jgi:hypothetical protein